MSDWTRVSKAHACPVCGRPDWCLTAGPSDDPAAAICARVASAKVCGAAGWLHVFKQNGPTWAPWRRTLSSAVHAMQSQPAPGIDLAGEVAQAEQWVADHPDALERFSRELGVTVGSLRRLGVGYSTRRGCWLFPMSDATGRIVGVRLRLPGGKKLSIRGGREGLFLPSGIDHGGRLLIVEGPTDCAAALDLGFAAVGRPSCRGGVPHLTALVGRLKPQQVIVVADCDAPGRKGAAALAQRLRALCGDVCVVEPPAGMKDARAWKQSGATRADVLRLIDAAEPLRLKITTRTKGRKRCKTTATV